MVTSLAPPLTPRGGEWLPEWVACTWNTGVTRRGIAGGCASACGAIWACARASAHDRGRMGELKLWGARASQRLMMIAAGKSAACARKIKGASFRRSDFLPERPAIPERVQAVQPRGCPPVRLRRLSSVHPLGRRWASLGRLTNLLSSDTPLLTLLYPPDSCRKSRTVSEWPHGRADSARFAGMQLSAAQVSPAAPQPKFAVTVSGQDCGSRAWGERMKLAW